MCHKCIIRAYMTAIFEYKGLIAIFPPISGNGNISHKPSGSPIKFSLTIKVVEN